MFSLLAINKSSIVFILSLDPFLVDLLVLCPPPRNAGGLLVFWCFQGFEIKGMVIYGSINDDLIWLVVFPQFMPYGGAGEHVVLGCCGGIWDWNIGKRWVEQRKETNIYQQ